MLRIASRPGFAAAVTGYAILSECAAARLLMRADGKRVYVLGRAIPWECAFRSRTGLPCPGCGLTRSVVLSLHGDLGSAWRLAPGGPVFVLGLEALAVALLALACVQALGGQRLRKRGESWLWGGALVYASAAFLAWIGGWMASFSAALSVR